MRERDNIRFDKMEERISTLIAMVGKLNDQQKKMDSKLETMQQNMETRFGKMQHNMDAKFDKIQTDQSSIRDEIIVKLKEIQADQDYIWEKAVKNERQLAKLKNHLQL